MTLAFTPEALEDFNGLIDFPHARSPKAAALLSDEIFAALDAIDRGDIEGPEARLISGDVVRSWPVRPVRLYYERAQDRVVVLRIYHQSRSPIAR